MRCGNFIIVSVSLVVKYCCRHSGRRLDARRPYTDDQSMIDASASSSAAAAAYTLRSAGYKDETE